jgi:hypothetical protein
MAGRVAALSPTDDANVSRNVTQHLAYPGKVRYGESVMEIRIAIGGSQSRCQRGPRPGTDLVGSIAGKE